MGAFLPCAAIVAWFARSGTQTLVVLGATAVIAVVGLVDDLKPLPARLRFGAQLAAAIGVVWSSAVHDVDVWTLVPSVCPVWVAAALSVLWIVWMTNLYNFMDGIDGLAGGQAVIGGIAIAVVAWLGGASDVAGLVLLLVAAAVGFLRFNYPPASIFMGDVGSTAIGFFVASVPFLPHAASIPVEVVAIAFSMFILDATITLLRRVARGERFFEAHRSHLYQRLLTYGVPHRNLTLAAYAAMLVCGLSAVGYSQVVSGARIAILLVPASVFSGCAAIVASVERRREAETAAQAETTDRAAA